MKEAFMNQKIPVKIKWHQFFLLELMKMRCQANENVETSNSNTAAQACKQAETPESRARDLTYESPCDIVPLPNAPERKQRKKQRSLILTDTPEKKLGKKQK